MAKAMQKAVFLVCCLSVLFFCTKFFFYSINFLNLDCISLASDFDVRSLMGKRSAEFTDIWLETFWARFLHGFGQPSF